MGDSEIGEVTVVLPYDSAPKFQDYARPEMLVTTEWVAEHLGDLGLVVAESDDPVVERDDTQIRAFRDEVMAHLGQPMIDVRSPGEYTGELLHMPDYPQEGALRGGHIPGARSVPWARAAADDATFRTREQIEAIYAGEIGLRPEDDVVVYCRIGERSSHTWFVLHHLMCYPRVRNYHRPCTESRNTVPI